MVGIDTSLQEPESLRLDHRLLKLAGAVDVENRYLPAVLVTALSGDEEVMGCSGVALSRHVVLTSGHCVCARRPGGPIDGGSQTINASACFEAASVETVFYKPSAEKGASLPGSLMSIHHGRVQPHPALHVMLDGQGRVSSSHADLALIFLDKPLESPGMPLSDEEVSVGDSVIIVGYGYDEDLDVLGSERRSSMNTITRLGTAEDERVLVQQPGGHRYRLDSGGPCLIQGAKGPALVGISSRWLGEGAAFTSIHGYRDWLRAEVQRAEMTGVAPQ
jgi:hypothetical protein